MKNKSTLFYALALVGVAGTIGIGSALADDVSSKELSKSFVPRFHHFHAFDNKADILGLGEDELKAQLQGGKTFLQVAAEQGLTRQDLQDARRISFMSKVDELVQNGELTQQEAGEKLETFDKRQTRNQTRFEEKADILGLSPEELEQALASGKTFKQVAQEQGITQEELEQAREEHMQARMQAHLDQLVQDGKMSQEEADEKLESIEEGDESYKFFKSGKRGGFHIRGEQTSPLAI